jgi:hypothetical protein
MDIFATYATDEKAEVEGRWLPLGDAEFLVARAGNHKYNAAVKAAFEANKLTLDAGGAAAEARANEIFADVMANTILLGWKGVMRAGKPWDYSYTAARAALGLKEFRLRISALAENFENFLLQEEADQGNA